MGRNEGFSIPFAVEETEQGERHDREELGWAPNRLIETWRAIQGEPSRESWGQADSRVQGGGHLIDWDWFPRWFQSPVNFHCSASLPAHRHHFCSKYFRFIANGFRWLSQLSDGLFLLVEFILFVQVLIHFQVKYSLTFIPKGTYISNPIWAGFGLSLGLTHLFD